jgi:hypothetical protein
MTSDTGRGCDFLTLGINLLNFNSGNFVTPEEDWAQQSLLPNPAKTALSGPRCNRDGVFPSGARIR